MRFNYEKHDRHDHVLYVIQEAENNFESIGSLYLSKDQEPIIIDLVKKLNDWDSTTERRKREGVSIVTG